MCLYPNPLSLQKFLQIHLDQCHILDFVKHSDDQDSLQSYKLHIQTWVSISAMNTNHFPTWRQNRMEKMREERLKKKASKKKVKKEGAISKNNSILYTTFFLLCTSLLFQSAGKANINDFIYHLVSIDFQRQLF